MNSCTPSANEREDGIIITVRYAVVRKLLFGGLMVLMPASVLAQEPTPEELLQSLIGIYNAVVESQSAVVESQSEEIELLKSERSTQKALVTQLGSKIKELEGQIVTYKEIVDLKNQLIKTHQDQIAIHAKLVESLNEATKQLAQTRKTTVWGKIAESIVPIASIVAVVAAGGN